MVTTFYPPYNFGGDGIGIQLFSRALSRRGHDVTVVQDISAYRVLSGGDPPSSDEADDGVQVVRFGSRMSMLSTLLTQQIGRPVLTGAAIQKYMADRQFDVINYHNISLVGGPGILSYGRGLKLYMAHEHWLVCPMHVLWRHKRELCTGRQCLRCSLHHRRPPQLWRYTGWLENQLKNVDAFIAMSEFSRDKHREFGFPREMEVVNCFLPEMIREAVADPLPHDKPYFLFVGRLERIKGLDDVIPLFAEPGGSDLLIVGDGEHTPKLRQIAAGLPRVRFLGRLEPDALLPYYRNALALIVPSVCFETFGITIIEAFRQGIPVIARRIGPYPEIVERSGGGLLFADSMELRGAMQRIELDQKFRSRMAEAAYRGFVANWSEDAVLPKYLNVVRRAARVKGLAKVVKALEP